MTFFFTGKYVPSYTACRYCTVRDYWVISTYVLDPRYFLGLRTDQFVCPIYSTPFDVIQSVENGPTVQSEKQHNFWSRSNFEVLSRPLIRKFSRAFVFEQYFSQSVSNISDLGGTHVQQSFRSRRNICAAVFYMPFPPILCGCRHFMYVQKRFNIS